MYAALPYNLRSVQGGPEQSKTSMTKTVKHETGFFSLIHFRYTCFGICFTEI